MNISRCTVDKTLKIHCKLPFTHAHARNTRAHMHTHMYMHTHIYMSAQQTLILSSLHPTGIEQYRPHNQFSKIWKCIEGI